MDRQRCTVDAIIDAANPMTLFRHYTDLVKAGKDVVYTDIPRDLAPAFVELALKVKDAKTKSVVFKTSEHFNSSDPDFDWMQADRREGDPPAAARPEQAEAAEDGERGRQGRVRLQPDRGRRRRRVSAAPTSRARARRTRPSG